MSRDQAGTQEGVGAVGTCLLDTFTKGYLEGATAEEEREVPKPGFHGTGLLLSPGALGFQKRPVTTLQKRGRRRGSKAVGFACPEPAVLPHVGAGWTPFVYMEQGLGLGRPGVHREG